MKASDGVVLLLRELQADGRDYQRLKALLEAQFQGALRHEAATLQGLAAQIESLCSELELRRDRRRVLMQQLLKGQPRPSKDALLASMPPAAAGAVQAVWTSVEQQVRDCKDLNLRNCRLITEQHEMMQRLMGLEEPTYAQP